MADADVRVRVSCDGSGPIAALEAVMEQVQQSADLAEFRAVKGRAPEPSPERTERVRELQANPKSAASLGVLLTAGCDAWLRATETVSVRCLLPTCHPGMHLSDMPNGERFRWEPVLPVGPC